MKFLVWVNRERCFNHDTLAYCNISAGSGLALIALVAVIMTSRRQAELIERQQQRLLMLTETATEVLSLKEQLNEPKQDSNLLKNSCWRS